VSVVYADDEPSGLAELVGELIRQNLERDPARARRLVPTVATIAVPDAQVAMTLEIDPPRVSIAGTPAARAHLRIRAASDALLRLTGAPLRLGFPDPLRPAGRAALADLVRGRVRVRGLLRHPVRTARLSELLSVAGP
jgi:hypothetical protein